MKKEEWMGIWGKIFETYKEDIKDAPALTKKEEEMVIIGVGIYIKQCAQDVEP